MTRDTLTGDLASLRLPPVVQAPDGFCAATAARDLNGAIGHTAADFLAVAACEPDPALRRLAFAGLCRLAGQMNLIGALTDLLTDHYGPQYAEIRWMAATALGWFGPAARPALRQLGCRMLADRNRHVRAAAAGAIARIGPDVRARRSLLTAIVFDRSPRVRHAVARALGRG